MEIGLRMTVLSCQILGNTREVKSAPHSPRPHPLAAAFITRSPTTHPPLSAPGWFVGERCMILPHDGFSSTVSNLADQRHPVQSRGRGVFLQNPPPSLLYLSLPSSFPPSLPSCLTDHTVEVLSLHSLALTHSQRKTAYLRLLKIRLLALLSLYSTYYPPAPVVIYKTQSSVLNSLKHYNVL
jgi:hypothetical protein